jgi:pimeloyl-ACP methyl ester carboxylesterase
VDGDVDELTVSVDGAELLVRGWGEPDGRPLLCWPGAGPRGSMFMSEAGPLLARDHGARILALDPPGFGGSPPLERHRYAPGALVDLIPPLASALGLDRFAFLGFSWGGDLGCHFAARRPEQLTALVVLDAGYRDPPVDPTLSYEQLAEQSELRWQQMCAPSWEVLFEQLKKYHRRWSGAIEESYRAGWREEDGRLVPNFSARVVAGIEFEMARAPASAALGSLAESRVPVLLVPAAAADEADLNRFAADVPQAEIARIEGVGHDVLSDGGPEVVDLVGRWLAEHAS